MTTQTSRLVEATQFTIQDYEVFKTGTVFDNKFRQAAMELMKKDEQDPKSELNKLGMKEVRRVRVLREAADTEGKELKLVYETKSDKRELARKAFEEDQKRAEDIRYTFPVWISDAKAYFAALFAEHIDWVDNRSAIQDPEGREADPRKAIAEALEAIAKRVNESRLESLVLQQARVDVYKLIHSYTNGMALPKFEPGDTSDHAKEWPPERIEKLGAMNDSRKELFLRLDFVTAALRFIGTALFDKSSFLEYAKKLDPRPPQRHQGKPKQHHNQQKQQDAGPSKTKLQKQGRQPKAAAEEKKPPQPQA